MTDRETLLALAERCEQASGPDRELDARIHYVLYPDQRTLLDPGSVGREKRDAVWGTVSDLPIEGWQDWLGLCLHLGALPVTASFDAALSLLPTGGAWRRLTEVSCSVYAASPYNAKAQVRHDGYGATPALQMCAACLRALASQGEQP